MRRACARSRIDIKLTADISIGEVIIGAVVVEIIGTGRGVERNRGGEIAA